MMSSTPSFGPSQSIYKLRSLQLNKAKRVLFIEDDEDFGDLMQPCIEQILQCQVTRATDPYEAINHFMDGYFDLIILDWNLPDMNGIEALKRAEAVLSTEPEIPLKWEQGKVPVIVLSGIDRSQTKELDSVYFRTLGFVSKKQGLKEMLEELKAKGNQTSGRR